MATLHYTFQALDVEAFERALQHWAERIGTASRQQRQPVGMPRVMPLALDGKGLCGIHGQHGEELPGVRLVALYDVDAGVVLAQKGGQDR